VRRSIRDVRPRRSALALVASGLALSACGAAATSAPLGSGSRHTPTHVALAWFKAINADDPAAALKLFDPEDASQIAWMYEPASKLSHFSNVKCSAVATEAVNAHVLCTFAESASPTEGTPDVFWTIALHLSSNHAWLITSYGQG
jgi:hypothetical protein